MRIVLILNAVFLLLIFFAMESKAEDPPTTCPQKCTESKKNCELSCSQIVGGGAKSKERRECVKNCDVGLGECNERCVNPTPRPSLKPERYHDKSCPRSCELTATDCNEVCTKYTGGGAKSGKKAICRKECSYGLEDCKNWCVNPTPKPTLKPDPLADEPCPEKCRYKKLYCEASCSVYMGGGAKSEKRSKCMSKCRNFNDECLSGCKDNN